MCLFAGVPWQTSSVLLALCAHQNCTLHFAKVNGRHALACLTNAHALCPAAVYVANIVEEEQPPWTAPDDPEADVETEDESATAAEGEGEGGDAAAEADAGEGEGGEGKGTDEDAAGGSGSGSSADYSTKLLRYVAASAGQEFLTALELRRPTKADEEGSSGGDGADAQKPEAVPVTFRVLDEKLPLLEVGVGCCLWRS